MAGIATAPDHRHTFVREKPGMIHAPDAAPGPLSAPGLGWVAAHGGAGVTTLSIVLGGRDLGARWPDAARAEPARIMLVARTHAQGLRAASRGLNALREGRHPAGMQLVGLVLVADAPGPLPPPLVTRIRLLRSIVPVWRVPWIAPWRLGKQVPGLPKQAVGLGRIVQLCETGDRRQAVPAGSASKKPATP
jgi:hypothetical protein